MNFIRGWFNKNWLITAKKNTIVYQAWAPLMRGRLLDNELLKGLAEKYNKSVAQIILRWDLQKGIVTIPKSINP